MFSRGPTAFVHPFCGRLPAYAARRGKARVSSRFTLFFTVFVWKNNTKCNLFATLKLGSHIVQGRDTHCPTQSLATKGKHWSQWNCCFSTGQRKSSSVGFVDVISLNRTTCWSMNAHIRTNDPIRAKCVARRSADRTTSETTGASGHFLCQYVLVRQEVWQPRDWAYFKI